MRPFKTREAMDFKSLSLRVVRDRDREKIPEGGRWYDKACHRQYIVLAFSWLRFSKKKTAASGIKTSNRFEGNVDLIDERATHWVPNGGNLQTDVS